MPGARKYLYAVPEIIVWSRSFNRSFFQGVPEQLIIEKPRAVHQASAAEKQAQADRYLSLGGSLRSHCFAKMNKSFLILKAT
jgi:hypothetical protein